MTSLFVEEGQAIALEPVESEHLQRLLGGLVDVRDGRVTVSRVVGHVRLPTRRVLRIRSPKAPASSVLAWAAYVDPRLQALQFLSGRVPVGGDEGDIASLLARLFVMHLEDAILRHGLLQQYRRSRTESETVRGRIDFAQLTRQGANLARVPCEVWERNQATPLNRFFAAALAACARDGVLRTACDPALSRVQARMSAIAPAVDLQLLAGGRALDRAERPFAPVIALARILLTGVGVVEGAEKLGSGFLINLETLFERTVVRAFRDNGIDVTAKSPLSYARVDGASMDAATGFEIDAFCRGLPAGDVVVDAKYKRHISSNNLHQMIAYCALTGATHAAFIVPAGMVVDRRTYVFEHIGASAKLRIDVHEFATDATDIAGWRTNAALLAARLRAA